MSKLVNFHSMTYAVSFDGKLGLDSAGEALLILLNLIQAWDWRKSQMEVKSCFIRNMMKLT